MAGIVSSSSGLKIHYPSSSSAEEVFDSRRQSSRLTLLSSDSLPTTHSRGIFRSTTKLKNPSLYAASDSWKWRTQVSSSSSKEGSSSSSSTRRQDVVINLLKSQLYDAIAPLDRGVEATPQEQQRVDEIARKLEAVNAEKEPLKSTLLNGKWELLYTTSQSILKKKWPKLLRPNGKIYQAINVDTLRAQNLETWPFFNQATANLVPLNEKRVAVNFDFFKIAGLIPIESPGSGRGQLEITYLDEELRISRGDRGNLFILKMVDPSYRVPL
ncbi:unnamed protein product [Linum trigynum]|uniref:Plastid lipid-associated protein/fibrillin conserved domain-containing protein n=1 Tax=Linum trigynum TaxID=586398 RepID=A0AAV2EJ05_9ROSI